MKKTIILILALIMLFTSLAYADSGFDISFSASETTNGIDYYLKIKGNTGQKEEVVSIKVEDSLGNPAYMGQSETDANGNYNFNIKLTASGTYNAFVNSFYALNPSSPTSKALSLPDENAYNDGLAVLNAPEKTTDDYKTFFDNRATEFGLDDVFYLKTNSGKSLVINELFAKKGSYTIDNISPNFLEGVITGIVKSNEGYLLKDELIRYYIGDVIPQDERYLKLYNTYVSSVNTFKEKVWTNMLSRNLNGYTNIQSSLYASVVKTALDSMNNQQLDTFLLNNLELSDYENMSPVKKTAILTKIKPLGFDTVEMFIQNYNSAKTDIEEENQEPEQDPPPPLIQGGGGGGGGGAVVKEYEKLPESVEEEKEEEEKQNYIEAGFTDLTDVPWAKDAIVEFKRKGIVNGKTETEFAPLEQVTRAEFLKILVNAFDIKEDAGSMKFTDVLENDWYYPYVLQGYLCGLLNGYEDGSFRPNDKVTREQMVTILYRYLQKKHLVEPIDKIENKFSDYNEISDYARTSVLVLNNAGYVNGVGSGMFMPKKEAGRAEVCVLIHNILNGGAAK